MIDDSSRSCGQLIRQIVAVVAFGLLSLTAHAQVWTFNDPLTTPGGWSHGVWSDVKGDYTVFVGSRDGEPCRAVRHALDACSTGANHTYAWHRADASTFSPASYGPLLSVSLSVDHGILAHSLDLGTYPWGDNVSVHWVVEQNGVRYLKLIGDLDGGWQTRTSGALSAVDFEFQVDSNTKLHPDFSASGAPIRFGLVTGISACSTVAFFNDSGFQNFAVSVEYCGVMVSDQPLDAAVCPGGSAMFETAASSPGTLGYQWQREVSPGSAVYVDLQAGSSLGWDGGQPGLGAVLSGVETPSLTIAADAGSGRRLGPAHAIRYRCRVISSCGSVTHSEPASLDVCVADFDCSGFVDTDDFTSFVLAFEAGSDYADVDGSGFVDTDDFTFFVLAFEAGC